MANDNSDDLVTRVKKWLKSQGYPLEMEAAQIFRQAGFRVDQSQFYTDPNMSLHLWVSDSPDQLCLLPS